MNVRKLNVRGIEIEFREFASGYISIGRPDVKVASKAMLDTSGMIRGFLGALATYMDKPNGTFERGFHSAEGIDAVLQTWDEKMKGKKRVERAYLNWKYLRNEGLIALLKSFGVEREDEGNYHVAIGAKRNGLYRMYVNIPQKWAEFEAEHGEIDWKSPEGKRLKDDYYTKKWAVQNRHDGFEALLRLLDGEIFIGMEFKPNPKYDVERQVREFDEMMRDHYITLWDTAEARAEIAEAGRKAGEAARALRNTVIAAAANPEFKHSEFVQAAVEGKRVAIYKAPGETQGVTAKSLVGKRIMFVYGDGSPIDGASYFIPTEPYAIGAFDLSVLRRGFVSLVD